MLISLKILHSNKFLYFIDSNCFIDCCTCTCILATSVTYMTTDCWKWIVLLDQCKSFFVSALCSHLQVTLYWNMCWTCCLTWSCTSLMCVDTVNITVIFCPHILAPLLLCWKWHLRINNFCSILLAKLLSKCCSTCRTNFNASSTSNTVIFYNMCYICRT